MSIKSMPVWKWALLLLVSLVLGFLQYGLSQAVQEAVETDWVNWITAIVVSAAMLALYALFVRWFEKHPAQDLPFRTLVRDTGQGLGIGVGFFVLVVLAMWLSGLYRITGTKTDQPLPILTSFFMFLSVGVGEEIIFRGILVRWIDEKWGFVAALIVSSVLFGLLHIFQPGATWWSSLAIAVEAGLLLGAAYRYAGTLWLPVGIHWAWNFTQGNVFGFQVSGSNAGVSLLQGAVKGPDFLTGGVFGAEASAITVVLGLGLSIWFLFRIKSAKQTKQIDS